VISGLSGVPASGERYGPLYIRTRVVEKEVERQPDAAARAGNEQSLPSERAHRVFLLSVSHVRVCHDAAILAAAAGLPPMTGCVQVPLWISLAAHHW
jgi:hypothetical protein